MGHINDFLRGTIYGFLPQQYILWEYPHVHWFPHLIELLEWGCLVRPVLLLWLCRVMAPRMRLDLLRFVIWITNLSRHLLRCKWAYESKTPNDIDIGMRATCNGSFVFREHSVRPESSSKVALGKWAILMLGCNFVGGKHCVLFFKAATIAIRVASNAFPW